MADKQIGVYGMAIILLVGTLACVFLGDSGIGDRVATAFVATGGFAFSWAAGYGSGRVIDGTTTRSPRDVKE